MIYAQFFEENDWEGETWAFYIPVEGNEKAIQWMHDNLESVGYRFGKEYLREEEVDVLVKYADGNYMPSHQKLSGIIDLKALQKGFDNEDDDPLYKGGIVDFIK